MRRLTMLILGSVVALASTGCGSAHQDPTLSLNGTGSSSQQVATGDASAGRTKENKGLVLGSPATLASTQTGQALELTALDLNDAVIVGKGKVPAGSKVVTVQFQAMNNGSTVYDESLALGAAVVDANGTVYPAMTVPVRTRQGETVKSPLGLQPESSMTGYVPFTVPVHAKIKSVRFGLEHGKGDLALWRVPTAS